MPPPDFIKISYFTDFGKRKKAIHIEKKKMGRPTSSPKTTQFSVRFDEDTLKILDTYCTEKKYTRPQGVREAVRKLKEK